jgi:hypothetical protein
MIIQMLTGARGSVGERCVTHVGRVEVVKEVPTP